MRVYKPLRGVKNYKLALSALIIGLNLLTFVDQSYGQDNINLQDLNHETQKLAQGSRKMTFIWWIPKQYWLESLKKNPRVTKKIIKEFLNTVRPYTIVAVVDGWVGGFGGVTYKNKRTVRDSLMIKDAKGNTYTPISDSLVGPNMKNFLQMVKPVIANLLGPMGKNMNFFLFPSKGKNGKPIADATSKDDFSVLLDGKNYEYHLPLESLLPPKYDPKTNEKFPGNYNYNPYTGHKLVSKSHKKN